MKSIRSHTRPRRGLAVAGLLVLTGMMATGCGDDDDPSDPTQVGDVITPVVVDVTTLAGTTVDVVVGGIVDVNVPDDSDVAAWTATVDDEEVVAFVAGVTTAGRPSTPASRPSPRARRPSRCPIRPAAPRSSSPSTSSRVDPARLSA